MKNIKSYLAGLAAIGALAFTGCETDVDPVLVKVPQATQQPNTTILELKTEFWDDATNYCQDIGKKENGEDYIIHGRVISSDYAGNVFKSLIIQDETCALAFSINTYDLYVNYRVGQEIVVNATGMQIGKYNGLQQIGKREWYENGNQWEVSFMPLEVFRSHIELNDLPDASKVDTITINRFSELPSDPDGLRRFQSQLVRFNNVKFQEGGVELFSEYQSSGVNRVIEDANGATLNVRTSGYSDFWNYPLPEGNGDLVCILGYYGTSGWQLTLIDYEGCMNFGNPTQPGEDESNGDTIETAYTVDQAIAIEATGRYTRGWVTGYIVGTVAPEVSTVSTNEDIEWGDQATLAGTLVIAPDPECKEVSECIVLELPLDSKLREIAALRDNPGVYKKQIWLYGTLEKYMDTWGLTGNKGTVNEFKIEGVQIEGSGAPAGDGSKESPYNVAQVQSGANGTAWVTGYIVGTVTEKDIKTQSEFGVANANPANVLIALTPDVTDYTLCVPVQLTNGTAPRTAINLKDNPGNLGKVVKVYGSLEAYFGVAGVKSVTDYELDNSQGGTTPEPPTPTTLFTSLTDDANGWTYENIELGSLDYVWQWDASYKYLKGNAYKNGAVAAESYAVSPVIDLTTATAPSLTFEHAARFQTVLQTMCGIYARQEGETSWTKLNIQSWPVAGAWTFASSGTVDMSDFAGKKVQVAFKYASTSSDADTWEVKNLVVSATGGGQGSVTPDPDPTPGPDTPTTPGEDVEIKATQLQDYVPGTASIGGYTIVTDKAGGTNAPIYHAGTSAVRLYADNTIKISGGTMTKITFTLAGDAAARYTTVAASTGSMSPAQAAGDTSFTWVGNAADVTFTIGHDATLGTDGAGTRGQIRFTAISITAAK